MLRRLHKSRRGTAEIVGTILFLVILFFFFSNVFLWHNQVTREMDQLVADKTNSAVRIETAVLPGTPVTYSGEPQIELGEPGGPGVQSLSESPTSNGFSLAVNYAFYPTMNAGGVATIIDTAEKKRLVADLRLSINASYDDDGLNEPCFVYILDCDQSAWVNTGLTVMKGYRWSNATISLPSSYIDGIGQVKVRFADASSQLGFNDTTQGTLNVASIQVCADSVALEVTNLGGSEATLSRLWIVNAIQTDDTQTDHMYANLTAAAADTTVAGGSTRTITFNPETEVLGQCILVVQDGDNLVVNYAPPPGQIVIFRVLTTLGNTAACSIDFPE
ncbi:MAG: hypothetical protein ABR962_03295 [Candidatus Bathyarchaeia archaeon]